MIIEQYESNYYEYVFSKKSWTGREGHNSLLLKGVEEIMMFSGYWTRECGVCLCEKLASGIHLNIDT